VIPFEEKKETLHIATLSKSTSPAGKQNNRNIIKKTKNIALHSYSYGQRLQ
jgi:hypothetical protein